jgi:beta-glucosidase
MVLNEPAAFTALGYFGGIHAPGKISPKKFPAVVHHATMSMGIGGRIIRKNVPNANIGTTFSCSPVHPKKSDSKRHQRAAERLDILLNRLFVEPVLGLGYPKMDNFRYMERLEKHIKAGDMEQIAFDFDFIGLQNYTQTIAKPSLVPYMRVNQVKPARRGVPKDQITDMNWEVSPQGMYDILKKFAAYPKCPPILITENGAAFPDVVQNGQVDDVLRTAYFKTYLAQVLKAKQEGIDIRGYFVWTLLDNFEWAEGYRPRFGLVHVDFKTQVRTIKNSGKWFKDFLQ